MARPNGKTEELADEDTNVDATPGAENVVHERTVQAQKFAVIAQDAPKDAQVAPSPGTDRTPGEPTPTEGPSDTIVLTVPKDQADEMKLLLDSLTTVGGPGGLMNAIAQLQAGIAAEREAKTANEAGLSAQDERLRKMGIGLQNLVTPEVAFQELRTRDKLEARALGLDKTTVGGRYLASDGKTYIDANGNVIS